MASCRKGDVGCDEAELVAGQSSAVITTTELSKQGY